MHKQYRVATGWRSVVRMLFAAFIITLILGSADQTPFAQAAPAGATFTYSMKATRSRSTDSLCPGDEVNIYVYVTRTAVSFFGTVSSEAVEEARVEAVVANLNNIGTISPQSNTTGWDMDNAGSAKFVFTAKEPGTVTVAFQGTIYHHLFGTSVVDERYTVEDKFVARVIPCEFKVTTLGDWHVPGPANTHIVAISDEAVVKRGPDGNYAGAVTVNWVASAGQVGDCDGAFTIGSSQVDWAGKMDDSGQLTINGNYQPAVISEDATCANAQGSATRNFQFQLTPDPVNLSVDSSGGVSNQSQVLEGPGPTSGSVIIVVVPEKCSGTASC